VLVEYDNGESRIIAGDYVKEDEVLAQFKEYSQQSGQKFLSFSELGQIVNSSLSSPSQSH
jgi:hypothetical protein